MRSASLLIILTFALAFPAAGQAQSTSDSLTGELERVILALEKEWMDGVVRRDGKLLDRLMADDFLLLGERWNGQAGLTPKQPWIRNSLTTIEARSFTFDKVTVQVVDNTVVFHCLLTFEATVGGRPWGGTVRVTDVWVRQDGHWRVLARHASRATPSP